MASYRSIFISDIHLGMGACRADDLCAFLKANECEHLYLVGDIIDGWKIKRSFRWPQSHSNVIRRLLTKAKRGTKITYITGNHDEFLRAWCPHDLGGIELADRFVHVTLDGRRLLDLRYVDDASMDAIAQAISSTAGSVRVMLFRIRDLLAECVKAELAKEAS